MAASRGRSSHMAAVRWRNGAGLRSNAQLHRFASLPQRSLIGVQAQRLARRTTEDKAAAGSCSALADRDIAYRRGEYSVAERGLAAGLASPL